VLRAKRKIRQFRRAAGPRAGALAFLFVAIAIALVLISCGQKDEAPEAPPTVINPGGQAVDPATAGSVTGAVTFDGDPPARKIISMSAVPNCAKEHAGDPAVAEDVVLGDNRALQNVVVYLKGDFSRYSFTVPQVAVDLDQKGCQYRPHVLALMAGQPLLVANSDKVSHNIHPIPKSNREWNESQPPGSVPLRRSFAREEVAIPVKCNIHLWMKAYIAVFGAPYFAVTGRDGTFELRNVPPGTYTLVAWHETYGVQERQNVTVAANQSEAVAFTFSATAAPR
jgi:hypothetical protein